MRRLLTLAGAWLAAAVVATGVAWQGVSVVGNQVTDRRPPSLTAAEIEAEVAAADADTGGAGAGADAGGGAPTTTSTPPSTTPTTTPASGATPPAGSAPIVKTYDLTGGSVTLAFAPSGVSLVVARPNAGYETRDQPADDGGRRVEFEGPEGRSRIEAWWDGSPQVEIDDDGAEGGGSGPGDDGASGPG